MTGKKISYNFNFGNLSCSDINSKNANFQEYVTCGNLYVSNGLFVKGETTTVDITTQNVLNLECNNISTSSLLSTKIKSNIFNTSKFASDIINTNDITCKNLMVRQNILCGTPESCVVDDLYIGIDSDNIRSGGVRLGFVKKSGNPPIIATSNDNNIKFCVANTNNIAQVRNTDYKSLMILQTCGNLQINGNSTVNIEHPVYPNKTLVYSSVQSSRCDIIYRGTTRLKYGKGSVNIDKECVNEGDCTMTSGTFESLCSNPQYFLQNTSSFDKVIANITGSILTITCENTSSKDTIYWMVIGERKDNYILNSPLTNKNGSLITEI